MLHLSQELIMPPLAQWYNQQADQDTMGLNIKVSLYLFKRKPTLLIDSC
jgi:hypothetical protein